MKNADKKGFGGIEIIDDRCGMDYYIIKNVWLEPGSDLNQFN